MRDLLPSEEVLRDLLSFRHDTSDPLREAQTVLASGDPEAIRLVGLGAALKAVAIRERQGAGIAKAQTVKKKYPGRTPATFKMGRKKLAQLEAVLANAQREEREVNLSQVARDLNISRSTVHRYLKATPGLLGAVKALRKAKGQATRGDRQKQAQSELLARLRTERALKEAGQSRSHRPVYEAVAAARKAKRTT
jgi:AraC-like DNA-binding protein